jgi:hypothetical protein
VEIAKRMKGGKGGAHTLLEIFLPLKKSWAGEPVGGEAFTAEPWMISEDDPAMDLPTQKSGC